MASELNDIVKRLDLIARKGGALGLPVAGGSSQQLDIGKESVAGLAPSSCLLESTPPLSHLEAQSESSNMEDGIRNPTTPVFKRIKVTYKSGNWLDELEDAAGLGIWNLNNVSSGEEAARARLIDRQHIETLVLVWEWNRIFGVSFRRDDEVLENLQPHPNLKKLIIKGYYGKLPSWMENLWLSKLETLKLDGWLTLVFTPLGKLPSLKYLFIKGSPHQEHQLREGKEAEDNSQLLFPSLRVLKISHCVYLERLPLLPPTLTELCIESVGLKALPGLRGSENEPSPPSSLASIRISECSSSTSLREGFLQHCLGNLEALTIASCVHLKSFPKDGLRLLVSLKSLDIEYCGDLTWSAKCGSCLPSSLVDLKIIKCRRLCVDSFFSGLKNLTSLSSLQIDGPKLRTLRFETLVSLRRLKIDCLNLHPATSFRGRGPLPLEYLEITYLHFLGRKHLQNLASLQELRIQGSVLDGEMAKNLCSLPSLQKSYIDGCKTPESLPDELESLTMLEELCITDCPDLKSLPDKGLPASLIVLAICNCDLPVNRCVKGGPDWHKIAHITYVEIEQCQIETEAWKQELVAA